jgi:superfamily II DNA or RNA helicase
MLPIRSQSATPERSDGLTQMVFACTGGILYEVEQGSLPTIIPDLKVVRTSFSTRLREHRDIVKKLIVNEERNQLIVQKIQQEAKGNFSLVLSDRLEHLNALKPMIEAALPGLRVEILTGKLPKAKRQELMSEAREKKIDVLLATQLAREGLDIPHLNRLFLTYPKKSPASVQQEVGRVMRPAEGKENAVVFDFIDNNGILYSQFRKRNSLQTNRNERRGLRMDEKEIEEYKELSDKVDSNEITFSELLRLNEFHVRFLRTSYHKLIENQEIQGELEESVELFKAAFEEAEAWNKVFATFIEEQGLTDES